MSLGVINRTKLLLWRLLPRSLIASIVGSYGRTFIVEQACSETSADEVIFDLGLLRVCGANTARFWYAIAAQYIDLIYPYTVKHPLSLLVNEGPYEKERVILRQDDVVIDAGANVGVWSVFAGLKIGPRGKVYAFEPDPHARKHLERTIHANRMRNIEAVPMALGETCSDLILHLSESLDASTGLSPSAGEKPWKTERVRQTTLDDFVMEYDLERIDFIKMDIEGMERNALKGAAKTIAIFNPRLALCTYHSPNDPAVLKGIITEIEPKYNFVFSRYKLYAWCDDK